MDPNITLNCILASWSSLYEALESFGAWKGFRPTIKLRRIGSDEVLEFEVLDASPRKLEVETRGGTIGGAMIVSFSGRYGLHFVDDELQCWEVEAD